jgi:hypothetical protein
MLLSNTDLCGIVGTRYQVYLYGDLLTCSRSYVVNLVMEGEVAETGVGVETIFPPP